MTKSSYNDNLETPQKNKTETPKKDADAGAPDAAKPPSEEGGSPTSSAVNSKSVHQPILEDLVDANFNTLMNDEEEKKNADNLAEAPANANAPITEAQENVDFKIGQLFEKENRKKEKKKAALNLDIEEVLSKEKRTQLIRKRESNSKLKINEEVPSDDLKESKHPVLKHQKSDDNVEAVTRSDFGKKELGSTSPGKRETSKSNDRTKKKKAEKPKKKKSEIIKDSGSGRKKGSDEPAKSAEALKAVKTLQKPKKSISRCRTVGDKSPAPLGAGSAANSARSSSKANQKNNGKLDAKNAFLNLFNLNHAAAKQQPPEVKQPVRVFKPDIRAEYGGVRCVYKECPEYKTNNKVNGGVLFEKCVPFWCIPNNAVKKPNVKHFVISKAIERSLKNNQTLAPAVPEPKRSEFDPYFAETFVDGKLKNPHPDYVDKNPKKNELVIRNTIAAVVLVKKREENPKLENPKDQTSKNKSDSGKKVTQFNNAPTQVSMYVRHDFNKAHYKENYQIGAKKKPKNAKKAKEKRSLSNSSVSNSVQNSASAKKT